MYIYICRHGVLVCVLPASICIIYTFRALRCNLSMKLIQFISISLFYILFYVSSNMLESSFIIVMKTDLNFIYHWTLKPFVVIKNEELVLLNIV